MIHLKASPKHPILPSRFSNKCSNTGRSYRKRQRSGILSCSSSPSTSSPEVAAVGHLVNEFGWRVRRLVEDEVEMRKVAQVQAEAFHVPVALFNDVFFEFFKPEVLSGLVYKLRSSPQDRYACLIAEPIDDSASSINSLKRKLLVGVADVTVLNDKSVLSFLEGAEEYLYISGIAVIGEFRRRKVGTVLLKACDLLSLLWGFDYLVLRAYDDDAAALRLYTNAGYIIVSGDPPWMTSWIGQKRRVLMIKRSSSLHNHSSKS